MSLLKKFSICFSVLVLGAFSLLVPFSNNSKDYEVVHAVEAQTFNVWSPVAFGGYSVVVYGYNVWTDGVNTYYSDGVSNYLFNSTLQTFSDVGNLGYSGTLNGQDVWTDGVNTYYSNSSAQRVWDSSSNTFVAKTWSGLTSFNGRNVWTDGVKIYYSSGSNQYVLDVATSTWSAKQWSILTSFNGRNVWTDPQNYKVYYSSGSNQYLLDFSTDDWTAITWSNLASFDGFNVWFLGNKIFYSNSSIQRVLNRTTNTWESMSWGGLPTYSSFLGNNVWRSGSAVYLGSTANYYLLNSSTTPTFQDVYNSGYSAGYDTGYQEGNTNGYDTGYNEALNLYEGFGIFSYATWSIVKPTDFSYIINDFTGRFTTDDFDSYPGGFIISDDLYMIIDDYFIENDMVDAVFYISFDRTFSVSEYNLFIPYNFQFGNTITFYFNDGRTAYFDSSDTYSSLSLNAYVDVGLVSIVIGFASSWDDYGYFGLSSNANNLVPYNNGYNDGYANGSDVGYNSGFRQGKILGYNQGYSEALAGVQQYTFFGLISAVIDVPLQTLIGLFNFELLGVNLLNLFTGLLTLSILLFIIKLILGGK